MLKGLRKIGFAIALIAGVMTTGVAIAQEEQAQQNETQEICKAKQNGIKKADYLSEYPTQEEVSKATGENKSELQALLKEKENASKIWDNCGK
jgi:hypothetical protein